MLGLSLGTRMTVIRLKGGGVALHSPIPLAGSLKAEVDAMGEVRHIICPNVYHHVYAGDALAHYPDAKLHGPKGLFRKRKDLSFDAELSNTPHPDWADDLVPITIEGCMLKETIFVHSASGTVVSVDLAENFKHADDLFTRTYLKANGIYGRVGWSRVLRGVYRDKKAARRCIDTILEHDFDRAIISHGEIIAKDAKDAIRATFHFL